MERVLNLVLQLLPFGFPRVLMPSFPSFQFVKVKITRPTDLIANFELENGHASLPWSRDQMRSRASSVGVLQVLTYSRRLDGHLLCFVTGSRLTWDYSTSLYGCW